MHISSKSRSITLKIQSPREFQLIFLLTVSEFESPLILYGRFSRDILKNSRNSKEYFSILTIKDCSPYEIVPTLKFSSSSAFWVTRYKGTKSLSSPWYLKYWQTRLSKLIIVTQSKRCNQAKKEWIILKMHALHDGVN
jgi:hypothetical protein